MDTSLILTHPWNQMHIGELLWSYPIRQFGEISRFTKGPKEGIIFSIFYSRSFTGVLCGWSLIIYSVRSPVPLMLNVLFKGNCVLYDQSSSPPFSYSLLRWLAGIDEELTFQRASTIYCSLATLIYTKARRIYLNYLVW